MEIGEPKPAIIVEPLEDPFAPDAPVEEPTPVEVPVEPEKVPA
jgi:hypothetical protein